MNKIKIIALCGKAGSGKDRTLQEILKAYPNDFHEIISCTTRPPREGEKDGKEYYFLSIDEFTKRLLNADLLEATEFNGWHYGTLRSSLSTNKINIGVFNPEGLLCLQEDLNIDLKIYYITCKDKTRLLRQLKRETNPNIKEIIRRYNTDEQDFHSLEDEVDCIKLSNESIKQLKENVKIIARERCL